MGAFLPLLLVLAASVKVDKTPLRSGCANDEFVVVSLPAGAPITIRFALSGESVPCYKVSAESGGKTFEGYLAASEIEGVEDFDNKRQEARWFDAAQMLGAIDTSVPMPSMKDLPKGVASDAMRLIETSQPAKALELLEAELRGRKDPSLMALAGVAAWRSDNGRRAIEFWRSAMELEPNRELENLIKRVERETKGDQSTEKLVGMRVVLRFESGTVPMETARQMLGVLDEEYSRIAAQVGCHPEERVIAIMQSREAYRKTTDAAEWSGGQYDGRIRVPVGGGQGVDASLRRVLAHETTHACLSMLGHWPAWLQEGLAQKLSGETLTPVAKARMAAMIADKKMPKLENLGQDWSRLDTNHATVAYALSLAAVEMFYKDYAQYGLVNLIRNPERLAQVTAELDKKLGL
jgi:hypothetical protein